VCQAFRDFDPDTELPAQALDAARYVASGILTTWRGRGLVLQVQAAKQGRILGIGAWLAKGKALHGYGFLEVHSPVDCRRREIARLLVRVRRAAARRP
jgi:hypothetical protein